MCVSIFLGTDLATEAVRPQNYSPSGLPSRGSCLAQSPSHHCYGPSAASPKARLSHGHNTNPTSMTGTSWIFSQGVFPETEEQRNVRILKLVKLICYGFTICTLAVCLTVLLSQKILLLNLNLSTSGFLPSPPFGQGSQAQSPTKACKVVLLCLCPWVCLRGFHIISRNPQFSSGHFSRSTLCDPMNRSTSGLPVHHQLPEFTQTNVHRVSDAIQQSHPLLSPSPPAPNYSQHQSFFQWVNSSHEVAKVLEFQL